MENEKLKEIIYVDGTARIEALVVGCDLDVGVSIVEKDNPENYLMCSNGVLSPVRIKKVKKFGADLSNEHTRELLKYLSDQIDIGEVDAQKILDFYNERTLHDKIKFSGVDKTDCPFNQ